MDKVNLKVVVDEILLLVVSRIKVDHMDMEGDQHRNSTMMILERDPSPLPSVHTDYMLSSKWVKAQQLAGQRMTLARTVWEYQTHQVVHHHTPTPTRMLVDPPLHRTSRQDLAHLHPDPLLPPTQTVPVTSQTQLLILLSNLSPHLSQLRNYAT